MRIQALVSTLPNKENEHEQTCRNKGYATNQIKQTLNLLDI